MKKCTSCRNNKDILCFKKNKGEYKTCKTCRDRKREKSKLRQRMYRKDNKELVNKKLRDWRNNNKEHYSQYIETYKIENKRHMRLMQMIISHKKKDVKYNRYDANNFIDVQFIELLIEESKSICCYCNVKMLLECENLSNNLLTVERKDNTIGHIKSNCTLCCLRCNNKKYNYEKMKHDPAAETERE